MNRILFSVGLNPPNSRAYLWWQTEFPAVAHRGADQPMNKPAPRRARGASIRNRLLRRTTQLNTIELTSQEGLPVNTPVIDPEIRTDLVARIRREIREGLYDTPEKFEAALSRMADHIRFS